MDALELLNVADQFGRVSIVEGILVGFAVVLVVILVLRRL